MNKRIFQYLAVFIAVLFVAISCHAQSSSGAQPAPGSSPPPATSKEDKSGTNPLNFQTEFRLFNEVQILQGSGYQNITTLQYVQPFASNFAVRLRLPFVGNDITGTHKYGVGDFNVKANWVPYMSKKVGVLKHL